MEFANVERLYLLSFEFIGIQIHSRRCTYISWQTEMGKRSTHPQEDYQEISTMLQHEMHNSGWANCVAPVPFILKASSVPYIPSSVPAFLSYRFLHEELEQRLLTAGLPWCRHCSVH